MPPAQILSLSKPLTLAILVVLLVASTVLAADPLAPNAQGVADGTLSWSPATMTYGPSSILSGSIGLTQAQETEKANAGVRARGSHPGYGHAGKGCVVACVLAVVMITLTR